MKTLFELEVNEFAESIRNAPELYAQRLLYAALAIGSLMFAGIIVFLGLSGSDQPTAVPMGTPPPSPSPSPTSAGDEDIVRLLSFVHAATLALCVIAGSAAKNALLRADKLETRLKRPLHLPHGTVDDPARIFLNLVTGATLVRLATLEAPALLGLVICLIAHLNDILVDHPIYWLNTGSTVLLIGYIVLNFPSQANIVELFRSKKEEISVGHF